jgi:hypothetical protein
VSRTLKGMPAGETMSQNGFPSQAVPHLLLPDWGTLLPTSSSGLIIVQESCVGTCTMLLDRHARLRTRAVSTGKPAADGDANAPCLYARRQLPRGMELHT